MMPELVSSFERHLFGTQLTTRKTLLQGLERVAAIESLTGL